MTTWIEQRVDALETRLAYISKQTRSLTSTELVLSGAGDPDGVVNAVQGTHYWDITNQDEYVNISVVGTPPEGTVWILLGGGGGPGFPHNILSATHTDSTPAAAVLGDIVTAQAGPSWSRLAISVPGANVRNVLGVDNGDTVPAWKTALDANNPVAITVGAAAAPGTSLIFSHRDHQHATPATWTATAHNVLSAIHGDSTAAAAVRGDVITSQGVGALWTRLAISVPAATFMNYLGTANGDTEPGYKALFDANVPTTIAPSAIAAAGTATVAARRDHTHGAPATYPATAHNLLSATHGDTTPAAAVRGDLVTGQGAGPVWARLALGGANGSFLRRNATDVLWSTLILPNAATTGDLLYASAANTISNLADVAVGQALVSGGVGVAPAWSASPTLTGLTLSGLTPSTVIYSNAARAITSLANAAGYLTNNGAGVLSWSATAAPTAHNLLSASHGDTTVQAVSRGSVVTGQGAVPTWNELVIGGLGAGSVLTRDANEVLWSAGALSFAGAFTLTIPATGTAVLGGGSGAATRVAYWSDANTITSDAGFTYTAATDSVNAGDYFVTDGGQFGITGNELLTVNAAGTFAFSGITGVTVENGDWIGNGAALARWVFESTGVPYISFETGATEYARITAASIAVSNASRFSAAYSTNAAYGGLDITNVNAGNAAQTRLGLNSDAASMYFSIFGSGHAIANWADKGGIFSAATLSGLVLSNGTSIQFDDSGAATKFIFNLTNGRAGINTTTLNAQTTIDQSGAAGAIPVLILDQGDASEQHIVCSMNGADQDFPNILQLDVTGSPALWWDESQNSFGFKNVSGLLLEDIDWIGNSQTSARLTFDSSGTNYAYFTYCRVGIGITIPPAQLAIDQAASAAAIPVLHLDQADVSEQHIVCSMSSADVDFPEIIELDVTGSPALWWDESEDAFGFKNITGLLVESGDFIGNSGTTAREVFAGTYVNFAQGLVYVNETANANMTQGITINQGANDNEIFTLKSSDVAHGATNITETDTYFFAAKNDGAAGGARLVGMRDADGNPGWAMHIQGFLAEAADTTHDETGLGVVTIAGHITSGASIANMTADGNVVAFRTYRGGVYESVAIITQAGDIFYDGALTPYDDYDDALAVQDAAHILSGRWNEAITYNAEALAAMGVISLRKDGTPAMVSHKRMTALMAGAIGQLYDRVKQLEARL